MASRSRKNSGLGRGLDALFADQVVLDRKREERSEERRAEQEASKNGADGSVVFLSVHDIKPNADQPRKKFNEEKIRELADSILEHGIIQPLVVRRKGDAYEIVAGERRWRAAGAAGLKEVPCIIRDISDDENLLIAMIENLQREDLDPIEEALGYDQIIRQYGLTQEQLSKSVSKSRPYITNSLRLLKLPEEIREMVSAGRLTGGHARALVNVRDPETQRKIAHRVIEEQLSVRETEKLVQNIGKKRPAPRKKVKDPDVAAAERRLKETFGTKVVIDQRGKNGEIRLSFYGVDDLNRILDMLMPEDSR